LVSQVFDTDTKSTLALPITKGIAGYVARTGEIVNLSDAYNDPRFNQEIDHQTGYRTKSMLTVPIPGPKRIVGVTSLINKLGQAFTSPAAASGRDVILSGGTCNEIVPFTKDDEETFRTFAMLCGLALHKALLLDEIRKRTIQLEVTQELMSYHAIAQRDEVQAFIKSVPNLSSDEILPISLIRSWTFDTHIYSCTDNMLLVALHKMFHDLGYHSLFSIPEQKLIQYTLTVRKNYRRNAYHNFTHAVSVTHMLYSLIIHFDIRAIFDETELYAMFIAALNHDIDHRGTNNQFQKTAHTALADFYSTSVMERHHFNHAVNILNTEGHNMFESMSQEDYKKCMKCLEKCILATDLALHFDVRKQMDRIVKEKGALDLTNADHLDLVRSLIMTCADLTSMTKPWAQSRKTADNV
ncbi:cGMP-specific 3',5'-cyclic phosphodiesterase, partial [Quaeritorhiza haematococci]